MAVGLLGSAINSNQNNHYGYYWMQAIEPKNHGEEWVKKSQYWFDLAFNSLLENAERN